MQAKLAHNFLGGINSIIIEKQSFSDLSNFVDISNINLRRICWDLTKCSLVIVTV